MLRTTVFKRNYLRMQANVGFITLASNLPFREQKCVSNSKGKRGSL